MIKNLFKESNVEELEIVEDVVVEEQVTAEVKEDVVEEIKAGDKIKLIDHPLFHKQSFWFEKELLVTSTTKDKVMCDTSKLPGSNQNYWFDRKNVKKV